MIYFAYGSNMLRERLMARVGPVRAVGPAYVSRFVLTFHKRGRDGSGKCTLADGPETEGVWGVLFEIGARQKQILDRFEGAEYQTRSVTPVGWGDGQPAYTYIASGRYTDKSCQPYAWYKALVQAGALQWALPQSYYFALQSVAAVPDPNQRRAGSHHELIRDSGYPALIA